MSKEVNIKFKPDCRYFRGDAPCRPHKETGIICRECRFYSKIDKKILLIKLGAIGDVIRTTPLLARLKKEYPNSKIYWLTYSPEVLPSLVNEPLNFDLKTIIYLKSLKFDLLINLDKDREACALAGQIRADLRKGFVLQDGNCAPADKHAVHKWRTGIHDGLNKASRKSYQEEIFEICGYRFNGEKYIFEIADSYRWDIKEPRPVVGLNTGCGDKWRPRFWETRNWIELAKALKSLGYGVLLLGGSAEDEKNRLISRESGADYPGHFPLKQFFSLVGQCDIVVTAVTMALHVAIGLGKKAVVFNNVFNRNEFELYGLGEILEPELKCLGCFKPDFDTNCPVPNCMELITAKKVIKAVVEHIG